MGTVAMRRVLRGAHKVLVRQLHHFWDVMARTDSSSSDLRINHRRFAVQTANQCLLNAGKAYFESYAEDARAAALDHVIAWYRFDDSHGRFAHDLFESLHRHSDDDQVLLRRAFDTLWKLMSGEERTLFFMQITNADLGLPDEEFSG